MTRLQRRRLLKLAETVSRKSFALANEVQAILGEEFHTHDLGLNAGEAAMAADETERLLKEWKIGEGP